MQGIALRHVQRNVLNVYSLESFRKLEIVIENHRNPPGSISSDTGTAREIVKLKK